MGTFGVCVWGDKNDLLIVMMIVLLVVDINNNVNVSNAN